MSLDVLAFFAHPDDETMLCGGLLALLNRQGARVHLLIATRGEGGEMGEPPLCERDQLGQVRERELRCAASALGVATLTLMDYTDPIIGPGDQLFAFTEDIDALTAQVGEAIQYWKVGAVISHGVNGEYGHAAHQLAYQAAARAVQAMGDNAPLHYTPQAAFAGHPYPRLANVDAPAHLILDIAPVLPQKINAAECHRTQHALFVRHGSEQARRPISVAEVVHPVESVHRAWPPVTGDGPLRDALANLLWESGCARAPEVG